MERTLSSDTEESFKSIPGSIRNSLRHIDLISTSVHVWPLRMNGKPISNSEDQEAARSYRIFINSVPVSIYCISKQPLYTLSTNF